MLVNKIQFFFFFSFFIFIFGWNPCYVVDKTEAQTQLIIAPQPPKLLQP